RSVPAPGRVHRIADGALGPARDRHVLDAPRRCAPGDPAGCGSGVMALGRRRRRRLWPCPSGILFLRRVGRTGRLFLYGWSPTLYAVVRTGGKQYRVEEGALLTVATLEGEPGKEVTFGDVLLLADGDSVKDAAKAKVTGEIVGHGKGEKIIVFRYKNKTRSRRRTGHRSKTTTVRITKIEA